MDFLRTRVRSLKHVRFKNEIPLWTRIDLRTGINIVHFRVFLKKKSKFVVQSSTLPRTVPDSRNFSRKSPCIDSFKGQNCQQQIICHNCSTIGVQKHFFEFIKQDFCHADSTHLQWSGRSAQRATGAVTVWRSSDYDWRTAPPTTTPTGQTLRDSIHFSKPHSSSSSQSGTP